MLELPKSLYLTNSQIPVSVPPGQRVLLKDVSWQDFEAILANLGESRNSRALLMKIILGKLWRH